jgi:hypothetical protein
MNSEGKYSGISVKRTRGNPHLQCTVPQKRYNFNIKHKINLISLFTWSKQNSCEIYLIQKYWVSGFWPSSGILNNWKTETFLKLALFSSSGEGRETPTLLGNIFPRDPTKLVSLSPHLKKEQIQFLKCCFFCLFRILNGGRNP